MIDNIIFFLYNLGEVFMKKQLIILMAGRATRLAPLSLFLPKGLLTINQKPACFNMVADLIANHDVDDITFVTSPSNNQIVKDFVNKSFSGTKGLKINFVIQENPAGPLHAFQLCESLIHEPTLLLLGDTLCETELDYSYDWVGYKTINDNSHSRWCLIKTDADEVLTQIIDKPEYTPETNKVLIGLYNFVNYKDLVDCLNKDYPRIRNELQLSSLIWEYSQLHSVKGMQINNWYDTGTLKDYNETLANNISGRSFNKFRLDKFGVLTKESSYLKLKTEIDWIKEVSKRGYAFLMPNFYGEKIEKKNGEEIVSYKIEYVNGKTLTEYFNYYQISPDNWCYIFDRLINTMSVLWENIPSKQFDIVKNSRYMYVEKTLERIAKWGRKDILEQEYIFSNGEKLLGFYSVFDKLKDKIERLINSSEKYASIIHGDPCFSNVIFFPETGSFKLIDPRGNFGEDSIYGDKRYDVAKLRHNYHGLYDNIVLNLFKLKEIANNEFEYDFFSKDILSPSIFDQILKNYGFDLSEIELIEGLLFISMIPLHENNKKAQIMFYLTGIKCLNNQLKRINEK